MNYKNEGYMMLGVGLIMCLIGAYSMIRRETTVGIVMGTIGVVFIGVSSRKRKKKK